MTMNAPVGPPIWMRLPPKREIIKPATMAVRMPMPGPMVCSASPPGEAAMAKAIARGRATMPTTNPAIRSAVKWDLL